MGIEMLTQDGLCSWLQEQFILAKKVGKPVSFHFDLDGTLIDIAYKPEDVKIDPNLANTLSTIERYYGPVAINTGRTEDEVNKFFPFYRPPATFEHGVMIRESSKMAARRIVSHLNLETLDNLINHSDLRQLSSLIEHKPSSRAIHFRDNKTELDDVTLTRRIEASMHSIRDEYNRGRDPHEHVKVTAGRMVFEFGIAGADKGNALKTIMALPGFQGTIPIVCGDTQADLPMFTEAKRMGGQVVHVTDQRCTFNTDVIVQRPSSLRAGLKAFSQSPF